MVQARIFSLKLLIYDLLEGYSKAKISSKLTIILLLTKDEQFESGSLYKSVLKTRWTTLQVVLYGLIVKLLGKI